MPEPLGRGERHREPDEARPLRERATFPREVPGVLCVQERAFYCAMRKAENGVTEGNR